MTFQMFSLEYTAHRSVVSGTQIFRRLQNVSKLCSVITHDLNSGKLHIERNRLETLISNHTKHYFSQVKHWI